MQRNNRCSFITVCFIIALATSISCQQRDSKSHVIKNTWIETANQAYAESNYSIAKLYLDSLIIEKPTHGEYLFKRAYSRSMLSPPDYDGAIIDYEKCIKLRYRVKSCYLNLGLIYSLLGNCKRAIEYFDMCLVLEPAHPNANNLKQICLEKIK